MSITPPGIITTTEVYTNPPQYSEPPYTIAATWSNLGPLTTTFTPPASCSTVPLGQLAALSNGILVSSERCGSVAPYLSCQPDASVVVSVLSPVVEGSESANWWFYNSPGLHCPTGYSTAELLTIAPSDVATMTLGGDTLRTTGTHIFCCPSGFSSSNYDCISDVTTATSATLCNLDDPPETTTLTLPNSNGSTQTSTVSTQPSLFAWDPTQQDIEVQVLVAPVYMIHQRSDVPGRSLSMAAKIAIGVVVPVVLLCAIGVGALCFVRRRKSNRRPDRNAAASAVRMELLDVREESPKRRPPTGRKWQWI